MKLGEVLFLLGSLDRRFREKKHQRLYKCTSHVSAVLSSGLYEQCSKILEAMRASNFQEELGDLLKQSNVQPPQPGLPPLPPDSLKVRIEQIPTQDATEFYLIQLPGANASQPFRRAGLILRQHLVDGEVKSLFIAGIERGSPADRAYNIKSGDQILSIVGFPLDWRTLAQLRYGLINAPEVRTLKSNANLFELAEHLLNEPYRNCTNGIVSDGQLKPPNLIVARNPQAVKHRESQAENVRYKCSIDQTPLFHETVLETDPNSPNLGIQLGYDKNDGAIHVVSVRPDSQAGVDGILKVGDRVVEVNYQDIQQLPAPEALKRVKSLCHKARFVHIKVQRPIITREETMSNSTTGKRENRQRKESLESSDSSAHTGLSFPPTRSDSTVTAVPAVAEPASVFTSNEENALTDEDLDQLTAYWKSRFPPATKILIVEYDTEDSVCGLGLGIEGTMEKETDHDLPRPHHYVIEVLPESPEELREYVKPGDELLEVNHVVVYEMDHLDVARVLHEIPNHGYLIFARSHVKETDAVQPVALRQRVDLVREVEEPTPLRETTKNEDTETLISSGSSSGSDTVFHPINEAASQGSGSDVTSDIDKCPAMDKVIYFKAKPVNGSMEARYSQDLALEDLEEQQEPKQIASPQRKPLNFFQEKKEPSELIELKERPCSVVLPEGTLGVNGHAFSRLPMPVRVAPVTSSPPLRKIKFSEYAFTRKTIKSQSIDKEIPSEVKYDEENECLAVQIFKECGEFLGLELDAENGGPEGIRLMHITPSSALDRVLEQKRHSAIHSGSFSRLSSSSLMDISSGFPLPQPGDWIVGVAGCSFRHRSEFQARLLLRRLVLESGSFEIRYIPSETSIPLHKESRNGIRSEPDLSRSLDQ